jgi:hypothetical protein
MAFTSLTLSLLAAGKAITQDLWTKVKDNFDDHESRISSLEATTSSFMPLTWSVDGDYSTIMVSGLAEGIDRVHRLPFAITVLNCRLLIRTPGNSGTTQINVQYKRGGGAWTSIFSTKPSVAFGVGSYAQSSNQVITTTALLAGDLIRMNVDSAQGGEPSGFDVFLDFELP